MQLSDAIRHCSMREQCTEFKFKVPNGIVDDLDLDLRDSDPVEIEFCLGRPNTDHREPGWITFEREATQALQLSTLWRMRAIGLGGGGCVSLLTTLGYYKIFYPLLVRRTIVQATVSGGTWM